MDGINDSFRVTTNLHEVVSRSVDGTSPGTAPRIIERVRHASTRRSTPPAPQAALPIDHWTVPLVAARLRRMARIFARFPNAADLGPKGYTSSMPTPILERSRDYAPDTRLPPPPLRHTEVDLATTTFEIMLRMFPNDDAARAIIWSIALRKSFAECAEDLQRQVKATKRPLTGEALRQRWVNRLGPAIVELFSTLRMPILVEDINAARAMSYHRKL